MSLCLQEVRAREEQVGPVLPRLPYQYFATTGSPGTRGPPCFPARRPSRGRRGSVTGFLTMRAGSSRWSIPTLYVVSVYVPNSQRGLPRLPFRLRWDTSFAHYVSALAREEAGGFLRRPERGARGNRHRAATGQPDECRASPTGSGEASAGCSARGSSTHSGPCTPRTRDRYTWWSVATRARERNIGWRIDYVCISEALRPRLRSGVHPGLDHGLRSLPGGDRAGRRLVGAFSLTLVVAGSRVLSWIPL